MLQRRKDVKDYVALVVRDNILVCSWVVSQKNTTLWQIKQYARVVLHPLTIVGGRIFSLTRLRSVINLFLQKHHLYDVPIVCTIAGSAIHEKIRILSNPDPDIAEIVDPMFKHAVWSCEYLYPCEQHGFAFYAAGIPRQFLLQWQLLFCSLSANVIMITTENVAHLLLYEHIHADAFRTGQLAHDLARVQNKIAQLNDYALVQRAFTCAPDLDISWNDEKDFVSIVVGACCAGEREYEGY